MSKKVLVFATHDYGGAGESAFRLTKGMAGIGYEVGLVVKHKSKLSPLVIQVNDSPHHIPFTQRVYQRINKKITSIKKAEAILLDPEYYFFNIDEGTSNTSISTLLNVFPFQPDIILLAWTTGFINSDVASQLQKMTGAKIYWLMTDMAPVTGGCHYAWSCKGYLNDCSNCPAILSENFKDRAKQNLALKKKNIKEGKIEIIAGSGWTHDQASRSSLFKEQAFIPVINGLIDASVYNSSKRNIAKQVFNISNKTKVIFSGATYTSERRKGISFLVESLIKLYNMQTEEGKQNIKILIAGNKLEDNEYIKQIPFEIIPIEFIKDELLLSLAYQAADVFICSSVEDSGPMMVNEALACGTPVAGFEMGLVANMVQNGINGYKVPLKNTTALANAVNNLISLTEDDFRTYSNNAVSTIEQQASSRALELVMQQISRDN